MTDLQKLTMIYENMNQLNRQLRNTAIQFFTIEDGQSIIMHNDGQVYPHDVPLSEAPAFQTALEAYEMNADDDEDLVNYTISDLLQFGSNEGLDFYAIVSDKGIKAYDVSEFDTIEYKYLQSSKNRWLLIDLIGSFLEVDEHGTGTLSNDISYAFYTSGNNLLQAIKSRNADIDTIYVFEGSGSGNFGICRMKDLYGSAIDQVSFYDIKNIANTIHAGSR